MATMICGIDPGRANLGVWIGAFDPNTGKTSTVFLSNQDIDQFNGKKKKSVHESMADAMTDVCRLCIENHVSMSIVETQPQWNTPMRLAGATAYGVLRGCGVPSVKFSSSSTKEKAIRTLAEKMGILDLLETPPTDVDKLDKKTSAKIRLMNKRNACRVAAKLFEFSADTVGQAAYASQGAKLDDMADAVLLACGMMLQNAKVSGKRRQTKSNVGRARQWKLKNATASSSSPPPPS